MHIRYLVYVSRLCDRPGPSPVPAIVRVSRANNGERAIRGALLFDGRRFCQYLEGAPGAIERTVAAIQADDRHHDMRVLANDMTDTPRFERWSMAYVGAATPDVIDTIAGLPATAVGDGFAYMLDQCEVEA